MTKLSLTLLLITILMMCGCGESVSAKLDKINELEQKVDALKIIYEGLSVQMREKMDKPKSTAWVKVYLNCSKELCVSHVGLTYESKKECEEYKGRAESACIQTEAWK